MVVVYPNGKCWFGVDSKTFKISINEAKGKVFGTVSEKGPNFSSWGEDFSASSSRGRGLISVEKKDPIVEAEFSGSVELRNVVWLKIEKGVINSNKEVLRGPFILFEFEDVIEAERVLHSGVKWFKGKCLILDWWNPSIGCLIEDRKSLEVWVRILGLPLHIWGMSFFKNLGEACGRFVGVDKDTVECQNL
ncbi:hypothetical protein VitviT2T_018210 [Vitis vinifera]|uniref:DUF4283 domain-containing protein n=1 Tax=Vitis vinifera TaxID=29760 RepID=A0ABY9CXC9_VITVI|nr:hypothetical protein VitviT2T_018210 [Vitis vinifera]